MILYLSSAQHSNLLDFTGLYDRDSTTIKKMAGNFVLKQFIVYDMRNFSHFSEVVRPTCFRRWRYRVCRCHRGITNDV
jgi:hypothetical protein